VRRHVARYVGEEYARETADQPVEPLQLKPDADQWWKTYYTPGSIKETERQLFSG